MTHYRFIERVKKMANWFDKDRGVKSGRISPTIVTPKEGDKVFVLGAENLQEKVQVSPGDFVEIKQVVDLTGYDLISANMDTIGTIMSQHIPLAGFPDDIDTIFSFDFNEYAMTSYNKIAGGFSLSMLGDMLFQKEIYSPDETLCREVAFSALPGTSMHGQNTPQAFPATVNAWTLQWWMNFNTDRYESSALINPNIFSCFSFGKGIQVLLAGTGGTAHEWNFQVVQFGDSPQIVTIPHALDEPLGWRLFTIRFDLALSQPNQLQLFIDKNLVGSAIVDFTHGINQPDAADDIDYADEKLTGMIDDIRMLKRHLSNIEIEESYEACVNSPSPLDYEWVMQLVIDGEIYGERVIATNEHRRWTDFSAPVRFLTGSHDVAFRLKLRAA